MPKPRLLYLVTEDWAFVSHRQPMARAARAAGFDVHVATRIAQHGDTIQALGYGLHPLDWQRGSTNPIRGLSAVRGVRAIYREVQPQIAHLVGLQASIVGSLAALGLPIMTLNALTGMGFAFTAPTAKARATRLAVSRPMRLLFNRRAATVLVQNPDDRAAMLALGVSPAKIFLIPGSGVDIDRLVPLPEPDGPMTLAYVGRLLADKGLQALMDAHAEVVARGHDIRLLLAGEPDPANPTSIAPDVLAQWRQRPNVTFLGQVADIRTVWAAAHIAVLPSRREGLPLSLMEAAACGRPLIATDVPGCREIARRDVNALLAPVDNAAALADAMIRLANDHDLRARFGIASRLLVETQFSSDRIGRDIVALYRQMLEGQLVRQTGAADHREARSP